jgi:ADP-heptose:LPS heptosyltransferase/predicted SAM-dependent methyltransferase
MTWSIETSCGYEAQKVKYLTIPYTRGTGLDIGCGPERIWPHAIGIDRYRSDKGAAVSSDIRKLPLFANGSVDWVFSSHAVEDFSEKDTLPLLREWWRVIRPGGHLVLYLPHEDHYPKIGEQGCNPAHLRNLNPQNIIDVMTEIGAKEWDILEDEVRSEGTEYSFYQVFRKRSHDDKAGDRKAPWESKTGKPVALVTRYGGFGDMVQASSVFPALEAQGFEVHINTTPAGFDVVKHDPHLSGALIQDKDQVPNDELVNFWPVLAERYAKVINLSESVEDTLLARPGSKAHTWPHDKRHFLLDRNYMEFTHAIAGVESTPPAPRFFASPSEKKWAAKQKKKFGKTVLWCLAGSSVHKFYPHQDRVIATIRQNMTDVRVVLVGDEACKILEVGFEEDDRVICRSGEWSIRQALAFAELADCVVGPETGVLNAVSGLDMPKVVMLSHSSPENLTKYWKNTRILTPEFTPCYPCHLLHYGWEHCKQDKVTSAARCAAMIDPIDVYNAICQSIMGLEIAA